MNPMVPLAVDSRSLDSLRAKAGQDPRQAVRQVAVQFESLFMRQLLKSMREAMPKSGMWDSAGQSMVQDMYDAQLSQVMSGRAGGLADVIARQLGRNLGGTAAAAPPGKADGAGVPGMAVAAASSAGGTAAPSNLAPSDASPGTTALSNTVAAAAAAAVAFAARQAALGVAAPGTPGADRAVGAGLAAGGVNPAWNGVAVGAARSTPPQTTHLAPRQADFVKRVWSHALLAEQSTGVPAPFIVGQAALESGWGRHEIRRPDGTPSFNLFGIKAGRGWTGDTVSTTTTEYEGGVARKQVATFRAYGSYAEAFSDWANLMAKSPRYAQAVRSSATVESFASGMQRAGYATDPAYGSKLERTIHQALNIKRLVI